MDHSIRMASDESVEISESYSQFLKIELKRELRLVEGTVDDMLTRLDEFDNLLSMVRSDRLLCTDVTIPQILASKPLIDCLCKSVDNLGCLVSRVEDNYKRVEAAVVLAESDLASSKTGKLQSFLKPLFLKGVPEVKRISERKFPDISSDDLYSTDDFFLSNKSE